MQNISQLGFKNFVYRIGTPYEFVIRGVNTVYEFTDTEIQDEYSIENRRDSNRIIKI